MRYVIIILTFILLGCETQQPTPSREVSLKLGRKELTKLFKGQEIFSIKGIPTKFEGMDVRANSIQSKYDHILYLHFEDFFFEGSNEVLLHDNLDLSESFEKIKPFILKHKIIWPKTELVTTQFNADLRKDFVMLEVPKKESIEYNRNRFLQRLYFSTEKGKMIIEESEILTLVDCEKCYDYDYRSIAALHFFMKETGIKFASTQGIKIIPNPITNRLQFMPDFSYVSVNRGGIDFDQYFKKLKTVRPLNEIKFKEAQREMKGFMEKNLIGVKRKEVLLSNDLDISNDLKYNNVHLIVKENTTLTFRNEAKMILSNCRISFQGTKDKPIHFTGVGKNSLFITDSDADFSHVVFDGLSNWSDSCKSIPSSVTLYNSRCKFKSCEFKNNRIGDDMVNVFHSTFTFDKCLFENTFADALDSDFSTGTVSNTTFRMIGNDAVDGSASEIDLVNTDFISVSDKAISAGENSNFKALNCLVDACAIGYVVKDGSSLTVDKAKGITNNDLDFAVFMKKPFYDYPLLTYDGDLMTRKYLIQNNSRINAKNKKKLTYLIDVQSKLYGNEFGKASK